MVSKLLTRLVDEDEANISSDVDGRDGLERSTVTRLTARHSGFLLACCIFFLHVTLWTPLYAANVVQGQCICTAFLPAAYGKAPVSGASF
jgi:hypothetical protein